MKINKHLFLLLVFYLIWIAGARAQDRDFGLWYEANAEKAVSKKIVIAGSATIRTFDNASLINEGFMELGASYNANKYLGLGASYRLGNYLDDTYYYHIRHKWFGDIKGSLPLGNLSISLRARFQVTSRTYLEDPDDERMRYDGRIKLRAIYKTPHFPLNPFLYIETFSPMFRSTDHFVTKSRVSGGAEYKLSKRHIVSAEYIYQRDLTPDLSVMNIVSLSYTFRF
jgi:hypothetical protein